MGEHEHTIEEQTYKNWKDIQIETHRYHSRPKYDGLSLSSVLINVNLLIYKSPFLS